MAGKESEMSANLFNYALLIQFAICSIWHLLGGNSTQAIYWLGAFLCTVGVTFRIG